LSIGGAALIAWAAYWVPSTASRVTRGEGAENHVAPVEQKAVAPAEGVVEVLARTELASDPVAAPTVIHDLAKQATTDAERSLATRTLARWLDRESERTDVDAIGNVPNLVEALAEVGTREAAAALVAALDGGKLDLPVETLLVRKLIELRDPTAKDAVERFSKRAVEYQATNDIELALRDEALAAAADLMTVRR
jgi:hypothetical protein